MAWQFFITGTDTAVGKTEVSTSLLRLMTRLGSVALGFKPYETGVGPTDAKSDSSRLQRAAGGHQPVESINVFRFRKPLAPAIASRVEGKPAPFSEVMKRFRSFRKQPLVVEGAGGLLVPLDERHDVIDAIEAMRLPVVVVARAGLGTINHTSLTLELLKARRVRIEAVVLVQGTNQCDASMAHNRSELERRYPRTAFFGPIPFVADAARRARVFDRYLQTLVG